MTDELREVARALRREPNDAMLHRVRVGVRSRIETSQSPLDVLAGWLRPAAISVAAIVTISVVFFSLAQEPVSVTTIADSILVELEAQLVVD